MSHLHFYIQFQTNKQTKKIHQDASPLHCLSVLDFSIRVLLRFPSSSFHYSPLVERSWATLTSSKPKQFDTAELKSDSMFRFSICVLTSPILAGKGGPGGPVGLVGGLHLLMAPGCRELVPVAGRVCQTRPLVWFGSARRRRLVAFCVFACRLRLLLLIYIIYIKDNRVQETVKAGFLKSQLQAIGYGKQEK